MTASKQQHLKAIRANTAYPTFRTIIALIAVLGYIAATIVAIGTLFLGARALDHDEHGMMVLGLGFVYSTIILVGALFWKEAATILADIGDSILETNSRHPL